MITSGFLKRTTASVPADKENETILEERRLNDLKARFATIGQTVEKSKRSRYEQLDEQMGRMEGVLSTMAADKTFVHMKADLIETKAVFEETHLDNDEIDAQFQKKVTLITDAFRENLDVLKSYNRGLLSEFAKQSSDRIFALRLALNKNQKSFQDHLDGFTFKVTEEIDGMRDRIEGEAEDREASASSIEAAILAELDKIEEDILIDRRVKEETNGKIKALIEDLNNDVYRKVENEKKEREMSNNSLLNLLEEACNRIERNFANF
jgi:hypothetical protein